MKKVMVFGSFDPLHEGHLDFFRQAKNLGDYLTVIVARDENIQKIKKHPSRLGEGKRLALVRVAPNVDLAVLGDLSDYSKVIQRYKPNIIALGYDQKIPETLKNALKKYKIVTLKPYKSEIYKSSKIYKK